MAEKQKKKFGDTWFGNVLEDAGDELSDAFLKPDGKNPWEYGWDRVEDMIKDYGPGNTEKAAQTASFGLFSASLAAPAMIGLVGLGLIIVWKKL